jgi:hypothetical protein
MPKRFSTDGVSTLLWWWGLSVSEALRVMSVVAATGRGIHAGQVKGQEPDEEGYPGTPSWVLGVRLTTSHPKS